MELQQLFLNLVANACEAMSAREGASRELAVTTTYDWDGLVPDTHICFKVRAYNSSGVSAYYPTAEPEWVCITTPTTRSAIDASAAWTAPVSSPSRWSSSARRPPRS